MEIAGAVDIEGAYEAVILARQSGNSDKHKLFSFWLLIIVIDGYSRLVNQEDNLSLSLVSVIIIA